MLKTTGQTVTSFQENSKNVYKLEELELGQHVLVHPRWPDTQLPRRRGVVVSIERRITVAASGALAGRVTVVEIRELIGDRVSRAACWHFIAAIDDGAATPLTNGGCDV